MDFVLYRQLDTSSKDKSAVASFSLPDEPVSLQVSRPDSKDRVKLSDITATHSKKEFQGPGASCSKLTTPLVNVSLKFQTLILQIQCYFLLKKCENPLHCKGFSHFFNKKITVYLLM